MNQTTGTLTAQMLIKEDAGSFTCLAENNAGRIEASVALVVVLKPIVEELEKKTYAKGKKLKKKEKKEKNKTYAKGAKANEFQCVPTMVFSMEI